jgi:hypothetical protein
MKRVATVIVALLALAAFPSSGAAEQKAVQQQQSHLSAPANPAAVTQPTAQAADRAADACAACRKWCTSRCVQDPGQSDCMCIRSDPN